MKTSFFKKILPMLAILLAVGGAFGTYAMSRAAKAEVTNFPGYIKNNPLGTSCTETQVMCSDVNDQICTINGLPTGTQLWKKNAQGRCVDEVYRIH
jgi:hypothetical protein